MSTRTIRRIPAGTTASTRSIPRSGHLLSPEFFDAERHPRLRFESTALELEPVEEGE